MSLSRRHFRESRAELLLQITLLSAAFLLPTVFMLRKSITHDEVAHIPAGYSYLTTGSITLNPMHPPLIKELCALPLLALGVRMPVDADTILRRGKELPYQFGFGKELLEVDDIERIVFWSRVPAVLLSLALATLVTFWARELWGTAGSLLALFLYVFDPTLTAHAEIVTTDVGFAFFSTLFFYLLRGYLTQKSWPRLIAAGVGLGLAMGAKFSGVLLLPLTFLLLLLAPSTTSKTERIRFAAGVFVWLLAQAYVELWILYFCPLDPLFYLKGLLTVNMDRPPGYQFYLMGQLSSQRHAYYLAIAWLVKTPLPALILIGTSVVLFFRGRRIAWFDETFLVLPALGLFVGYSLFADSLGVRYLIPCFPFLYIFAGRIGRLLENPRRPAAALIALLLAWQVAEFVAISPDHLSYFNEIAGGYRGGTRWLDDSNVEWGQGLIELRDYIASRPLRNYRLCFLGSISPGAYGLPIPMVTPPELAVPRLPPQTLIASAHCLARTGAYLAAAFGDGPQNWLAYATPVDIVGHAYYVYQID